MTIAKIVDGDKCSRLEMAAYSRRTHCSFARPAARNRLSEEWNSMNTLRGK